MYKGQSVSEREGDMAFVKRMNAQVKGWDKVKLDGYIDTVVEGFTEEQIGHMAWYLGVKHEQMLREKDMTMHQGDGQSDSAYGDSEDDKSYPPEQ